MNQWFSFFSGSKGPAEIPDIFPIPIKQADFISIDVQNIYARILTDTFERTHGLKDEQTPLLFDNCLASEVQDGLITMLSKAMSDKQDLFIVYIESLKLIRKADSDEQTEIREGYKKKAEPVKLKGGGVGLYVTFRNYRRSDMLKFYSGLEYCSVGGLWKQSNLSKAIQLKFKDMRASISASDSDAAKPQAEAIAKNLGAGRDVAMDGEDKIETTKPDVTATTSSLELITKKQAFYLAMPSSYFDGVQSGGMGDSGKTDQKAIDRGLKNYFFAIAKPVADGLFGVKTEFKSEDTEGLSTALEVLKTMDTTSNEFMSLENKTQVVNKAFGLAEDAVGDEPEPAPVIPPPVSPGLVPPKDPKTSPPPAV